MESSSNHAVITDLQETSIGITRAVGFVEGIPLVLVVIPRINQDDLDLIALESHGRCMLARSDQYIPRSVLTDELGGGDAALGLAVAVFLDAIQRAKQVRRAQEYVTANQVVRAGKST